MTTPVVFTHQAVTKVWELIQEEDNFDLKLRVYVTGGGCSGLQYGFTFEETIQADDTVVTKPVFLHRNLDGDLDFPIRFYSWVFTLDSIMSLYVELKLLLEAAFVHLLIDPLSLQYLTGAEIDYKEDIEGEQFIIRNPNATTTCGCGSSFATE